VEESRHAVVFTLDLREIIEAACLPNPGSSLHRETPLIGVIR